MGKLRVSTQVYLQLIDIHRRSENVIVLVFEPHAVFGTYNSSLPNACLHRGQYFGPYAINRYKKNSMNYALQVYHILIMAVSVVRLNYEIPYLYTLNIHV